MVTVTGLGQFAGSVTKTFYVVADGGGGSAWNFDLANATLAYTATPSVVNPQRVLPIVENYNDDAAVVPVHQWASNAWLVGFSLPRDESDEYHLANLSASSVLDGTGFTGFQHPFHFDKTRSGWLSSDDSGDVVKMKPGNEEFDFSELASGWVSHNHPPFFANGGRVLFIPGAANSVMSFELSELYNPSSVKAATKKVFENLFGIAGYQTVWHCSFSPDGLQALVCSSNNTLYHAALTSPYDFTDASVIGNVTPELGCRSATVLNDGKTLFVGTGSKIYEYSLVP